ncbi:MAG: arginase family protein [Thermoleophilia bacterium]|nr:arginase family protein [Thermoleophilia bacterium]
MSGGAAGASVSPFVSVAEAGADARPVLAHLFGADYSARAITPQRADLAPNVVRAALPRFSSYDAGHKTDLADWQVVDHGDAGAIRAHTWDEAFGLIERHASVALESGAFVVGLGGDHSVTWPIASAALAATRRRTGSDTARLGILQLDVHHDVRALDHGPSNGTPMRGLLEAGLVLGGDIAQVGIHPFGNQRAASQYCDEAGIVTYSLDDVAERGTDVVARGALLSLDGVDAIHLTVDIDVLDRAFAPGTAAALPGGLTPRELLHIVEVICADHRVASIDVVEFDPERDVASVTAYAAANVVMVALAAVARRAAHPN